MMFANPPMMPSMKMRIASMGAKAIRLFPTGR